MRAGQARCCVIDREHDGSPPFSDATAARTRQSHVESARTRRAGGRRPCGCQTRICLKHASPPSCAARRCHRHHKTAGRHHHDVECRCEDHLWLHRRRGHRAAITMLFPPDRYNEETELLRRIKRGETIEHYETQRLRKDGSTVHLGQHLADPRRAGRSSALRRWARHLASQTHIEAARIRSAPAGRPARVDARDVQLDCDAVIDRSRKQRAVDESGGRHLTEGMVADRRARTAAQERSSS